MRYELRRWVDDTRNEYVIRQTSDDLEAIKQQYQRAFSASTAPELLYIVDTHEKNDL